MSKKSRSDMREEILASLDYAQKQVSQVQSEKFPDLKDAIWELASATNSIITNTFLMLNQLAELDNEIPE